MTHIGGAPQPPTSRIWTGFRPIRNCPRWLRPFVDERVVLAVIAFNTLVVFCLGFPTCRLHLLGLLNAADLGCLAFYVVEAAAKIRCLGWRGYWEEGLNRFDFTVLVLGLPAVVIDLGSPETSMMIVVLRSARLLRFLRLLRFIPDRDHILLGVKRALKASVGLVVAMALYNLVLSLWACHMFADIAPEHFGDPIHSMYSMFKVFTVEGWFEIPDAAEAAGASKAMVAFMRLFFVFAVLTGGLLGVSLATAVFVDEMVMDNNQPLERRIDALTGEIQELKELIRSERR